MTRRESIARVMCLLVLVPLITTDCSRDRRVPTAVVPPAGDLETVLVERASVLCPAREDRHLRDLGEMRGEEAADRAGADHADVHANLICRYSRYGSGSISDPVTRRRSSGAGYRLPWR